VTRLSGSNLGPRIVRGIRNEVVAAVSAAVQAQRELAAAPWPAGVRLRVRMGLHTGAGIVGGDNYLGLDVNRAAPIAAAAHGEQILLSDATQSLLERLPPETRLRGLGQHRFKDLTEPERLYQAVIDGLEKDFLHRAQSTSVPTTCRCS
jgi:class 3 adenylate cyclase